MKAEAKIARRALRRFKYDLRRVVASGVAPAQVQK